MIPKIIHYFGGAIAKSYYNFLNNDIFRKIKDKGTIFPDAKILVQNAKIMLSMPYTINGNRLLDLRKTFIFRCINKLYYSL